MRALLLIDLQEDFFDAPGLRERRPDVVRSVRRWVGWARERGAPVMEVHTVLPPDPDTWALNMRDDQQPVVLAGTPGVRWLHELDLGPDEVVQKRRDDAFHRTDLRALLDDRGIDQLVIGGVSTEACVAMTAASAYAHDLRVAIAAGAVASGDDEAHARTLGWLRSQYRQEVVTP